MTRAAVEVRLSDASGLVPASTPYAPLNDIASEVEDLLPFDGSSWASESTAVYNDVKHADRRDPDANETYRMSIKNRLVFRIWVTRRLAVADEVISKHMWRLTPEASPTRTRQEPDHSSPSSSCSLGGDRHRLPDQLALPRGQRRQT